MVFWTKRGKPVERGNTFSSETNCPEYDDLEAVKARVQSSSSPMPVIASEGGSCQSVRQCHGDNYSFVSYDDYLLDESSLDDNGKGNADHGSTPTMRVAAKVIRCASSIVLTVLAIAAIIFGWGTYRIMHENEQDDFEFHYKRAALERIQLLQQNVQHAFESVEWVASMYTTIGSRSTSNTHDSSNNSDNGSGDNRDGTTLPYVTLDDFDVYASHLQQQQQQKPSFVGYLPLLHDPAQQLAWEAYSAQQLSAWKQQASQQQQQHENDSSSKNNTTASEIRDYIWRYNGTGHVERIHPLDHRQDRLSPVWQMSPSYPSLVNMEWSSSPSSSSSSTQQQQQQLYHHRHQLETTHRTGRGTLAAPYTATTATSTYSIEHLLQQESEVFGPESFYMHPIYSHHPAQSNSQDNNTETAPAGSVVGDLVVSMQWESFFQTGLHGSGGRQDESWDMMELMVVIESGCELLPEQETTAMSFVVGAEGRSTVRFLGYADKHDPAYNGMRVTQDLLPTTTTTELEDDCFRHIVHVYPTDSTRDEYETRAPLLYAAVVVGIFLFTATLFCIYSIVVERRQGQIITEARRTDAIVSDLFPKEVRDRIYQDKNNKNKKKNNISSNHGTGNNALQTSAVANKNNNDTTTDVKSNDQDIDDTQSSLPTTTRRQGPTHMDSIAQNENYDRSAPPIAELYPEATILFADIAGFTAWSSLREPAQVFLLLESIFHGFDEIAKRRGVFKVETVGDCYVAVCGLPQPNKDHAVVMARFARDCLDSFQETVAGLELVLGPDTTELAMRFGLHSGPVTAGVLRGERARFQLFGDSVNTASRIETTGKRNCIQVSEQTAGLLIDAGKVSWILPRDELVDAKGKGKMRTYWLRNNKGETNDDDAIDVIAKESIRKSITSISLSTMSELREVDKQVHVKEARVSRDVNSSKTEVSHADKKKPSKKACSSTKAKGKMQRLIDWNAEILATILKRVVAQRRSIKGGSTKRTPKRTLLAMANDIGQGRMVIDEITESISLPEFNSSDAHLQDVSGIELDRDVVQQLHQFVALIASMYRNVPFHNFEHASHVTMSVAKLLSRIVSPQIEQAPEMSKPQFEEMLHRYSCGIRSDPLAQFTMVLSGLIHDVDHRGVPNFVLEKEEPVLSSVYAGKSIAEQNSVDIAWGALLSGGYEALCTCIFTNEDELGRFRKLLVNSVIATDIFDKDLGQLRKRRWDKAFNIPETSPASSDSFKDSSDSDMSQEALDLKATIVLEYVIQASDVSHTMQHWHVYQKWNERLFAELYDAYESGRTPNDPSKGWYQGELKFFDNYIIPLAYKLKDCGVFGVSSDEYLNYALENRREWEIRGEEIVESLLYADKKPNPNPDGLSI